MAFGFSLLSAVVPRVPAPVSPAASPKTLLLVIVISTPDNSLKILTLCASTTFFCLRKWRFAFFFNRIYFSSSVSCSSRRFFIISSLVSCVIRPTWFGLSAIMSGWSLSSRLCTSASCRCLRVWNGLASIESKLGSPAPISVVVSKKKHYQKICIFDQSYQE